MKKFEFQYCNVIIMHTSPTEVGGSQTRTALGRNLTIKACEVSPWPCFFTAVCIADFVSMLASMLLRPWRGTVLSKAWAHSEASWPDKGLSCPA